MDVTSMVAFAVDDGGSVVSRPPLRLGWKGCPQLCVSQMHVKESAWPDLAASTVERRVAHPDEGLLLVMSATE